MIKLLIALAIITAPAMADIKATGELIGTYTSYIDRPTKESYMVNSKPEDIYIAAKVEGMLYDVDYKLKASNRLGDSIIEEALLSYTNRRGNHLATIDAGIIDSYRGTMSTTRSSAEQAPIIFKNSGVYNDEFMSGFLESTTGAQLSYSYIAGEFIITGRYLQGKFRVLDETKADQAMHGYESQYTGFEFDTVKSRELNINWKDNVLLFIDDFKFKFKLVPTHSLTGMSKLLEYSKTKDKSLFATSDTPYTVDAWRTGGTYTDPDWYLGYEYFEMLVTNPAVKYSIDIKGYFYYIGYNIGDYTPYASYGTSWNDRDPQLGYHEYIYGARYIHSDNLAIIAEYKKSNWIQHDTLAEHNAFIASGSRNIELVTVQVILQF